MTFFFPSISRGRSLGEPAAPPPPTGENHAWWSFDNVALGDLAATGAAIPDLSGEHTLLIQNTANGDQAIEAGTVQGQWYRRRAQGDRNIGAYAALADAFFQENYSSSFAYWTWVKPDSADVMSDGFTKNILGVGGWTNELRHGLSVYNNAFYATAAKAAEAAVSVNLGTVGTTGVVLLGFEFDAVTRRIRGFKNNVVSAWSSAMTVGSSPLSNNNFTLGANFQNNAPHPTMSSPQDRHLIGKWDEVGYLKRNMTSDEITWLYNGGAGRTYAEAIAYGMFDF